MPDYLKSNLAYLVTVIYSSMFLTIQMPLAADIPQKINIETYTCGAGWGSNYCKPHKMIVDLYLPDQLQIVPLIILQHGSGGVNAAVREKISLLVKQKYAVVVTDAFTSRGISTSHFDYAGVAAKGGNARSMAMDTLAIIRSLQKDKRINIHQTAVVGFSQGGLVGYWLKSNNFLKATVFPIWGQTLQPKLAVSMYGCIGEHNENFQFNNLPIEIIVGDLDPVLRKCVEFKNRLVSARQPSNVNISILKNADHGFDEFYGRKLWPKNQEVKNCYTLRKSDGTVENPFLGKSYKGDNIDKQILDDCLEYGQYSGNNGDPKIGDRPLILVLEKYLNPR
jgi:dienelactone hydrolase